MSIPAVYCHNLFKSFGTGNAKVNALSGVNLEVKTGEILMLMGPSGSGKTTLISIIAGVLTQDCGECVLGKINLQDLSNGEKTAFRRRHLGFVFQTFQLIPTLTVGENVMIPLILSGDSKKTALPKVKALLADLGIDDKCDYFPSELSGGQQQRVAIARAVIHHPPLIVCDEPTSYLDLQNGLKTLTLLREVVQKTHATLIIVTHDTRITSFADRIHHLEDGKIVS